MKDVKDLNSILAGAQLPALPQSAIRLLELSKDPNNGPAEFATPIEADPGLTGQVLRFVNSSYFGFSREISSVKLAITMVGVRTIKNFSLWSAVFSLMPNPRCGSFDLKKLWQDSLRRGLFSRNMGKLLGLKEAEDAFAAALLQDMAVPLLTKELPEQYTKLLEKRAQSKARLSDLEQEEFGWTHAEAAANMARRWNLPEEFVRLIENHAHIEKTLNEARSPANASQLAVCLSALLPSSGDEDWSEVAMFEESLHRALGSNKQNDSSFLEEIDRQFEEFAPLMKLVSTGKSLSEFYKQAQAQTAS